MALDAFMRKEKSEKKDQKSQKDFSALEGFNKGSLPGFQKQDKDKDLDEALKMKRSEPKSEPDLQTFQMHDYVQEEPGLEPAWNPVTVFASIYGGGAKAAYSIGRETFKQALKTGGREAAVGTAADVPISIAGEHLRDNYGWGPGLLGELALSFTSAFTVEKFIIDKLTSAGKAIRGLDDLESLAQKSESQKQQMFDDIEKVLDVSTDRPNFADESIPGIRPDRPMDLNELQDVPQIKPKETQMRVAEDTLFETIKRTDGKAYKSEASAKRAIKRKGLGENYKAVKASDEEGFVIQGRKFSQKISTENISEDFTESPKDLDKATQIVLSDNTELANRIGFYEQIIAKKNESYLIPKAEKEFDPIEKLAQEYGLDISEMPKLIDTAQMKSVRAGEDPIEKLLEEFGIRDDFISPESQFKADEVQLLDYYEPKLLPAPEPRAVEEPGEAVTRTLDDLEEPTAEQLREIEAEGIAEEAMEIPEDELLRYADEFGIKPETPKSVNEQKIASARAQRDIEEFLDEPLENFRNGEIISGREENVGFEDDAYYMFEDFADDAELLDGEDSVRDLGDFFSDVSKVMSGKLGLSIDDMSKNANREQLDAAERLIKDFKNHRSEATRAGIDLSDYYQQKGFNKGMADKLKDYNLLVTGRGEEVTNELIDRGNIDEKMIKGFRNPLRLFAIEVPYRQAGAPSTGHAFKVFPSVQGFNEDEGLHFINKISKNYKHLDSSDWGRVTLKAEDPNFDLGDIPAGRKEDIENAAKQVREYFDKKFNDLKTEGALERPFPESYILRQERKIEKLEDKLVNLKQPATKEKYLNEIKRLEENIENAKNIEYVPLLSWLEDEATRSSAKFGKLAGILAQKQRQVASTRYLYDNGHVKLDDIDIRDIVGHYARRTGKDIANQRLKNALEKDGLIRKIPARRAPKDFPHHWPEADSAKMPMFKDYVIQPRVKQFLDDFYNSIGKRNNFERGLTAIKMAQFFNPVIMPMYDTYQSVVLHGLDSWRLPGHIKDGIRSVLKQDQDFKDLSMFGGYSKPFASPLADWKDQIANAKMPTGERAKSLLNPLPWKAFKNYYNLVWDAAWQGDRMIRMASYKELLRKNMDKKSAAQLTALFHGDYASVPPQTRRALNHIFFTPTFKIVMAKWQANMAAAALETGERLARKSIPRISKKKIGLKRRVLAGGFLGLLAVNHAKDMLLNNLGFESDQWGRRYTQEVETDEGPREIVITFSDPVNTMIKYAWKVQQAIDAKNDKTGFGNLLDSFTYDLHPAWRLIISDLKYNRKPGGGKIYSEGDSTLEKYYRSSVHILENTIPLLDPVSGAFGVADTPEEQKNRKALTEQFGAIGKFFLNLVAFTYVRGPEEQRKYFKSKTIWENMTEDARSGILDKERADNYRDQLRELYQED